MKREEMKKADYRFPEVMNKTEASYYLWGNLNLSRLAYLIEKGFIRTGTEDGREVITKRELDSYTQNLIKVA